VQDAQDEGDEELAEFFSAVLENNLTAAQRAKGCSSSGFKTNIIPYRFVDGIMRACQRYSTPG